jgi:hypothetical protein
MGMAAHKKITDEELSLAVASSNSVSEALRKMGRTPHGGVHKHFTDRIARLEISTEHFFHSDGRRKQAARTLSATDVLILREPENGRRDTKTLRNALFSSGIEHVCAKCGQGDVWNGASLVLQVDHISGEWWDDRIENLRFLCPNCHAQELTRLKKRTFKWRKERQPKLCVGCSKKVDYQNRSGYCMECFIPTGARSKIEWPDVESLLEMLRSSNFMEVSRNLGVSDNAIRRHLRRRGIDPPKRLNKKQNNVL